MSAPKHTPGPWITDDKQSGDVFRYVMPENGSVLPICRLDVDRFEAEANARLIAAAPELLEALEAMLSHTADLDPMQGFRPEEDFSAVKQARAAIAKATGVAA